MEASVEKESAKVADAIVNGNSKEAAEALSRALLPMDHDSYYDFLQSVQNKTAGSGRNKLDIDRENNIVHLWSMSDLQHDHVIVTPGQNLSKICKYDIENLKVDLDIFEKDDKSKKPIDRCIDDYVRVNKIADPDFIMAGSTLKFPFNS